MQNLFRSGGLLFTAIRRGLLLGLLLANMATASASQAASPIISVGVANALGDGTWSLSASSLPFTFSGQVTWPGGSSSGSYLGYPWKDGADLYLGIITPKQEHVLTWSASNGRYALSEGLRPFSRKFVFSGDFSSASVLGSDAGFVLSGNEAKGMYLLFFLLTQPGADPGDPGQWLAVGASPFFMR